MCVCAFPFTTNNRIICFCSVFFSFIVFFKVNKTAVFLPSRLHVSFSQILVSPPRWVLNLLQRFWLIFINYIFAPSISSVSLLPLSISLSLVLSVTSRATDTLFGGIPPPVLDRSSRRSFYRDDRFRRWRRCSAGTGAVAVWPYFTCD